MQLGLDFTLVQELAAGVDEVGRGPLCGAVVTAAVILDPARPILGLNDSKKLSARQRERLVPQIEASARAWAIGIASVEEIDRINILQATMLAMTRAVEGLGVAPTDADLVLVDGNRLPRWRYTARAIVGGDALHPCISAASIIAKEHRDRFMISMAQDFPGFGWERNMGYGTAQHLAALRQYGPTPLHRTSFAPVAQMQLV